MAYIQVTSNTDGISFDVGIYASVLGFSKFFRTKNSVQTVALRSDWIEYTTNDGKQTQIKHTLDLANQNILVVESVNGVAPTSLNDLYDKLLAILV
jgi:hypothetical protein